MARSSKALPDGEALGGVLALRRHLGTAVERLEGGPLTVAASGGLDSSTLVALLAEVPAARARSLSVLHVHHGLQPTADEFAAHCEGLCARWSLPIEVVRVAVPPALIKRFGLEAAARSVRRKAFAQRLRGGGIIALAHHRDDQAETVLARLMRGGGAKALAAMQQLSTCGEGRLWRPLLGLSRRELARVGAALEVVGQTDPMNADLRFERNFIRQQLLPALSQRWPDASARLAAVAEQAADESRLLRALASAALDRVSLSPTEQHKWSPASGPADHVVSVNALASEPRELWPLVILELCERTGIPAPPRAVLKQLGSGLIECPADGGCRLSWPGGALARAGGFIHLLPAEAPVQNAASLRALNAGIDWDGLQPLELGAGFGRLVFAPPLRAPLPLQVRSRRASDRLQLPGHPQSKALRKIFQEQHVPAWRRDQLVVVVWNDAPGANPVLTDADDPGGIAAKSMPASPSTGTVIAIPSLIDCDADLPGVSRPWAIRLESAD